MNCRQCGAQISDTAKFCEQCGAAVSTEITTEQKPKRKRKPSAQKLMNDGERVTPNISLCDDGKYRWIYELSLFRNPTVFLLVWKIFFFIFLGIFAVTMLVDLLGGYMDLEQFLSTLRIMGIVFLVMTAIIAMSVLIYAAIMGGKYIVIFEMDDKGVNHKQVPTQAKKARKLGAATAMMGAKTGSFSTMGAGINATRTEMYSEFSRTRKVRAYPRRDLIKVNGLLSHNQVYAKHEDYDFVVNYILARVPEKARPNTNIH